MKYTHKPKKIVLVPYPAQGHVTPMLQLALALQTHGFETVMVTPEFIHNRIASNIESMDGISFLSVPDGLDASEPRDFFTISFSMENIMPMHLESILSSLCEDGGVACVVVDLLASWAIQVADRCKIPVAGFWPAMLATYNLIQAIPDMIKLGLISEFGIPQHLGTTCLLPGQSMLKIEDLPWLIGSTSQIKSRFRFWLRTLNRSSVLPWLLVNSFEEENGVRFHSRQNPKYPEVFQVAPLMWKSCKNPSFWEEDRSCINWLDDQNQNSVIYVSFGSWVGPIDQEKVTELALGLESTSRPFIWVLGPTWRKGLPIGYLKRVSKYGKIVSWAPQKEILKHKAVGCYITHCGWNSTMEAIECEKKLLCYPIAGDQFVNCTYIVKVWKFGLKMDSIKRDVVEKGVMEVMEDGGDMQQRVMDMKERITKKGVLRARNSLAAFIDDLNKL
ncbi:Udp-glycosyltransferase 82a1 [Thalictrum thalictroides]|uniref:Udp-glycosyltransferase 82a1 n=1 Tax=Thalictrum thalictroides TaxID=46969 RepID=A0A7J6WQ26_THATH|nr:Udp-glycosyltransferase 82a1 [Thalictrum thalictroides]